MADEVMVKHDGGVVLISIERVGFTNAGTAAVAARAFAEKRAAIWKRR